MSVTIKRKITIQWKLSPTPFAKANIKALGETTRKIGSSISGVSKMLSNALEQEAIMRTVIGADPKSPSSNWDKLLRNYWNSLTVDIPNSGKSLETGWIFDYTASDKKDTIKDLIVSFTSIKDDTSLAKHVMAKVSEEDKYKYGQPINPEDYMLWRYCLVYKDVANSHEDVNKSGHIRFYLFSQEEIESTRKTKFGTKKKAMETFIKLIADSDKVDNIIYIGISSGKMAAPDGKGFTNLDEIEKHMMLESYSNHNPNEFISLAEDANLETKAIVERYVFSGLFKRLPNSSVIVDAVEPSIVIGNNINEAVTFMHNPTNSKIISEYSARYKGLPKL